MTHHRSETSQFKYCKIHPAKDSGGICLIQFNRQDKQLKL
jgi:hypothetical protein